MIAYYNSDACVFDVYIFGRRGFSVRYKFYSMNKKLTVESL